MREPTSAEVIAYFEHMKREFKAVFVTKKTDPLMGLVGSFLDAVKIQDKETFFKRYTTTIGHVIYLPFEIGIASPGYSLWWQIQILAHECEHIFQFDGEWNPKDGPADEFAFATSYVLDPLSRALWEAKAYRVNLELEFWRTGAFLDPAGLVAPLAQYGLAPPEVQYAESVVRDSIQTIEPSTPGAKQNVISKGSQVAIAWLDSNVPDLKMAA